MPEKTKDPDVSMAGNLPVERPERFIRVYSNNAAFVVTPFDFMIIFGEVNRSPDKTFVEQTVAVTMSPQHAKALAVVLLNNVREYEKNVGKIVLPGEAPTPEENDMPVEDK
ncbi:MAG TPA: DUF3467 domain-containing protein [Candidatus Angelobacter sp.]|nr:DUF3467 domain-containing protein [Candidatus Angelobacter sp.]